MKLFLSKGFFEGTDNHYIDGSVGEIWDQIQISLNFTYTVQLAKDGLWSKRNSNGTWFGLFGMLQKNEAEILLGE